MIINRNEKIRDMMDKCNIPYRDILIRTGSFNTISIYSKDYREVGIVGTETHGTYADGSKVNVGDMVSLTGSHHTTDYEYITYENNEYNIMGLYNSGIPVDGLVERDNSWEVSKFNKYNDRSKTIGERVIARVFEVEDKYNHIFKKLNWKLEYVRFE